jgi:hypothetical protein
VAGRTSGAGTTGSDCGDVYMSGNYGTVAFWIVKLEKESSFMALRRFAFMVAITMLI